MKRRPIAKVGMLAAIRYRRPLLRFAKSMAKSPKRTTRVTGNGRRAAGWTQQMRTNPKAQRQVKTAVIAASAAAARARKLGAARAVNDQTFLYELRAAAAAMASGIAAAQAPKKKRRRFAKLVFGVGMIGAGAYAGYRESIAQRRSNPVHPQRTQLRRRPIPRTRFPAHRAHTSGDRLRHSAHPAGARRS